MLDMRIKLFARFRYIFNSNNQRFLAYYVTIYRAVYKPESKNTLDSPVNQNLKVLTHSTCYYFYYIKFQWLVCL